MASEVPFGQPVPTGMPAIPDPAYFSTTQWAVYWALVEATLPPIVSNSNLTDKASQIRIPDIEYEAAFARTRSLAVPPTRSQFDEYLSERATQNPQFIDASYRLLGNLSPPAKKQLANGLGILGTKLGAFFLTGTCVPFHEQPLYLREATLRSWRLSWFYTPRLLFKSITLLAKTIWVRTSPAFLSLSGYPTVPDNWRAGPNYAFGFVQIPPSEDDSPHVVETDILIVGSGCGGGVVARHLAKDCHLRDKVLVVDKGYHFKTDSFPMNQVAGPELLYENKGAIATDDSSVNVIAGSCWGGGGTINWSVMLETQDYVRQEWAQQGLPLFTSREYQDAMDHVWDVMGSGTEAIRHNQGNNVILEGSKKLGWDAKAAPQNCGGKEHYCGQCHLGCFSGEKQGPANCWLPDAAKAGAKFMEGFEVEKVIFEDSGLERVATGVVGTWTSRDVNGGVAGALEQRIVQPLHIKAKKIILSSGTLWTPVLLKKSGLENPNIGTNLHLHPCHHVTGQFPEDRKPWEGGIITALCTSFENLDGEGHGTKLETSCMVPYAIVGGLPWTSGLDVKLDALKYRQTTGFITLTRDRDSGRVFPDRTTGKPRLQYTPSAYDRSHALQGVIAVAKLCYVSGAEEIRPYMSGLEPFVRTLEEIEAYAATHGDNTVAVEDPADEDPRFKAWVGRIGEVGNEPPFATFLSAHQMGTCRMGSSQEKGVVDARGRVWGTKGLYIADASVFPSASGVNPMATNMAIAHCIAKGIGDEMKGDDELDVTGKLSSSGIISAGRPIAATNI